MKSSMTGKYVIVRTEHAGVFAGELLAREGSEAIVGHARRLWYWEGAASLSQLAVTGTSKPGQCKFPAPVAAVELLGVVEVLAVTKAAQLNIEQVPVWKQ